MSKAIPTPHDSLFRQFLGHIDTARDFLSIHLSPALLAVCDLDTLQLESGSFIEDDLRPYYSDILYSLETRGGTGYIYCVVEHQSTPDPLMAHRLHRYSIAAMQRHLDKGYRQLPLVIPVLFYHGTVRPYPYSTAWLDCFADPLMAGELYSRPFPLVDVTAIADDEILTHKRVALLEIVQKHIQVRDLAEIIDTLALLLRRERITDVQLASVLHYIVQAGETRQPRTLIRELAARVPKYEETIMTIAESLKEEGRVLGFRQGIEQGIEKGIEQGIEKGRREGEREAALKIARSLLDSGLDLTAVMNATGLSAEELMNNRH